MDSLDGVKWAYVTYSLQQRRERSKTALLRLSNFLRRFGVAIHPHVYIMPAASVSSFRAALSSRRRRKCMVPPNIFIHFVHPHSNASLQTLVAETLLVDLQQTLTEFEQVVAAADAAGRWVDDQSGERVLERLRGAKAVLHSLPRSAELLDWYGRLCRAWEAYFSKMHAAVLAKLRPPVYRRRYRVAAGQWFAEQRTSPLPGFESYELTSNAKNNRKSSRDTSSAAQGTCDKTG